MEGSAMSKRWSSVFFVLAFTLLLLGGSAVRSDAVSCPQCKVKALARILRSELRSCSSTGLSAAGVARLTNDFTRCARQSGCLAVTDTPEGARELADEFMRQAVDLICPEACRFDEDALACGGDCGQNGACVFDPVGKSCFCTGAPLTCEAPGVILPIYCRSPGQTCDTSGGLPGQCVPSPPEPCQDDGAGMCGGICSPGSQCLFTGVDCRCLPDFLGCEHPDGFCDASGANVPLVAFCPGSTQTCTPTNPTGPFDCTCS
jgi:hypothetical protein